jgi:hypothetical protein
LLNDSIGNLANAAIELGCSGYTGIPMKLSPEAIGLTTLKSGVDAVTGCIEPLLDRRELILIKSGKCDGDEFIIVLLILSSFVLTL